MVRERVPTCYLCVINRLFLNIGSHVGESAEGLHSSCWAATKLPGEVHLVVSVMTTVTEVIKLCSSCPKSKASGALLF